MIVAILLASLDRLGQRRHFRDIFVGVAAALALVAVGGVVAYLTIKTYAGSRTQTIFETITYLVAAAVLTYMTRSPPVSAPARSRILRCRPRPPPPRLSADLRQRTQAALDGRARWGL